LIASMKTEKVSCFAFGNYAMRYALCDLMTK
jgi:hypothetical protein